MTWAIDFDGTVADHAYPDIGPEKPGAIKTLLEMKQRGHKLILWTCRDGPELEAAVAWCKERGLVFDAVCENIDSIKKTFGDPTKVVASYYLDDKSVPPFPGWPEFRMWMVEKGYL